MARAYAGQQSAGSAELSGEGCGAGYADSASRAHAGGAQAYAAGTAADFADEEDDQDGLVAGCTCGCCRSRRCVPWTGREDPGGAVSVIKERSAVRGTLTGSGMSFVRLA
jgi:hypothetical protein